MSDGTTILGGDNKAAIAGILEAVLRIKELKGEYKTIELVFTCSEEVGNYGAIGFDYKLLHSKFGFCIDSSDPVGTVVLAAPFYERFDVAVIGKEAHPSRPKEAINTVLILKDILNKITVGQLDTDTILNIGAIQIGRVRNTIPGDLLFRGEIRSFKEKNLISHKKKLIKQLKEVVAKHKASIKFEFVRENPGYKYSSTSPVVKSLVKELKRLSLSPKLKVSWGVSDANIFNDRGLICFNLGDGTEFSHSTRERIKTSQLSALSNLLFNLARI